MCDQPCDDAGRCVEWCVESNIFNQQRIDSVGCLSVESLPLLGTITRYFQLLFNKLDIAFSYYFYWWVEWWVELKSTGSLFLTKSRHGIWYYQRWIPIHFRKNNPALNKKLKVSLQTCEKPKAIQLARLLTVKFDKLALQRFDNPKDFGKAMDLLHQSAKAWKDYPEYLLYEEHFLSRLSGNTDEEYTVEEYLLEKAEGFSSSVNEEFEKLEKAKSALEDILKNSNFSSSTIDQDELIAAFDRKMNPSLSDEDNPTLNVVFHDWCEAKKDSMRSTSLDGTYKPLITIFIRFVNDKNGKDTRVNELTVNNIKDFRKFLGALPIGIVASSYSITELVKLSENSKNKMGKTTLRGKYRNVGSFLEWISTEGLPIKSNLKGILTKFDTIKKRDIQERIPLTDDDIQSLFNSDEYTKTGKFRTSGMYWVPLISLFTGARMSELLQLEKHDIKEVDGIWVFSIKDVDHQSSDPQKHVKQDGSEKEVPIHNTLIELGFIKYVKTRKDKLFPDEPRKDNGKFDNFQKRFATYRKKHGVEPQLKMEKKDLHSFRHTVRTRLTELRTTGKPSEQFDEGIIDAIVGHESKDRSLGQKKYNHSQYIEAKSKALNRLQYDCIDFGEIKRWDTCNFGREINRDLAKRPNQNSSQ